MDAAAELGRNPVSKHQIQLEYGDEQADAGRDGRTRLARPNSKIKARTYGDRGIFIFPVQLTTSRIGNLTRLIHTLLYGMTIHTNILHVSVCVVTAVAPALEYMHSTYQVHVFKHF